MALDTSWNFFIYPLDTYRDSVHINNHFNVEVEVDRNTIIHSQNSNTPKTLIVATFRVVGFTSEQRPRRTRIQISFRDQKGRHSEYPNVVRIWPQGDFVLSPTEGAGISSGLDGMHKTGAWMSLPPEHRQQRDQSYLVGQKWIEQHKHPPNDVRVTLHENGSQRSGVVTEIPTVILLNRNGNEKFSAKITVDTVVDWMTPKGLKQIELHGSSYVAPSGSSIEFNPKSPPFQKPKAVAVDLDDIDTTFVRLGKAFTKTDFVAPKDVKKDDTTPVITPIQGPKTITVDAGNLEITFESLRKVILTTDPAVLKELAKDETSLINALTTSGSKSTPIESPEATISGDLGRSTDAAVAPTNALLMKELQKPKEVTKDETEWEMVDQN